MPPVLENMKTYPYEISTVFQHFVTELFCPPTRARSLASPSQGMAGMAWRGVAWYGMAWRGG